MASKTKKIHHDRPKSEFIACMILSDELFFGELVSLLTADEIATLCEALAGHHVADTVLQASGSWEYLMERDQLLSSLQTTERLQVSITVPCPHGCPQLAEYVSRRSQWQRFHDLIRVVQGDLGGITHVTGTAVDGLVFPTSSTFLNPRIGVSGCVHARAGRELHRFVRKLHREQNITGDLLTTPGFDAGVNRLIHCVGPRYASMNSDLLLYKAYVRVLSAIEMEPTVSCAAIASISTGLMGFPVHEAAKIALSAVRDMICSRKWDKKLAFVCVEPAHLLAFQEAYKLVKQQFFSTGRLFPGVWCSSTVSSG